MTNCPARAQCKIDLFFPQKNPQKMAEELLIQKAIQQYLNTSNRPYNANNLIDEFATKFKKPKVIKALQVLVSSKSSRAILMSLKTYRFYEPSF
jgi:hypothetical protein